ERERMERMSRFANEEIRHTTLAYANRSLTGATTVIAQISNAQQLNHCQRRSSHHQTAARRQRTLHRAHTDHCPHRPHQCQHHHHSPLSPPLHPHQLASSLRLLRQLSQRARLPFLRLQAPQMHTMPTSACLSNSSCVLSDKLLDWLAALGARSRSKR